MEAGEIVELKHVPGGSNLRYALRSAVEVLRERTWKNEISSILVFTGSEPIQGHASVSELMRSSRRIFF